MTKKTIITYEFATIYIEGQAHLEGETPLKESTFNNLWNFILSNKSTSDTDTIMSLHTRGGRRYIRTGRFVGTILTKDGATIEILPKIYKVGGKQEKDKDICRKVFLNMLRHFTQAKAKSFQNASLETKKNFPILEVYISNYLTAVEKLIITGIKKDYCEVSENQRFLKGKLNITKQITRNKSNKTLFSVQYNKYIEDIPQNRIIVTTLRKLINYCHSTTNKTQIYSLLAVLDNIPSSNDIESDVRKASISNRMFSLYSMIIKWSTQFLLNRGFTNFSGDCINQSLLFQAEKLFEDFVAYLFKKYAPTYNINAQNNKYFLVDRHNNKGMFRLIPDIVIDTDEKKEDYECIIVDTKWKTIDSSRPDSHYLIDMKDMYQLYAYGQKYRQGQSEAVGIDVIPKLVLVYPYSEKFTEKLPEFIYEDIREKIGLRLMVVPIDLTNPASYEKQIHNIIHSLDVEPEQQPIYQIEYDWNDNTIPMAAEGYLPYNTILVGCYKDEKHLDWILKNKLYNIRLGNRNGGLDKSGTIISACKLILYNHKDLSDYKVYQLDYSKQIIANNSMMREKEYPGLKINREYILYVIGNELKNVPRYDIARLKEKYAAKLIKDAPFFVTQ